MNPNEMLRKRSVEVVPAEIGRLQEFFNDLAETMSAKAGLGLAAPQVGIIKRIIAIQAAKGAEIYINPKIVAKSFFKERDEEGCLSIPGVYGIVRRWRKIKVEALNRQGKQLKFTARGLMARILQHEIDHLDGILFIDKAEEIFNS